MLEWADQPNYLFIDWSVQTCCCPIRYFKLKGKLYFKIYTWLLSTVKQMFTEALFKFNVPIFFNKYIFLHIHTFFYTYGAQFSAMNSNLELQTHLQAQIVMTPCCAYRFFLYWSVQLEECPADSLVIWYFLSISSGKSSLCFPSSDPAAFVLVTDDSSVTQNVSDATATTRPSEGRYSLYIVFHQSCTVICVVFCG